MSTHFFQENSQNSERPFDLARRAREAIEKIEDMIAGASGEDRTAIIREIRPNIRALYWRILGINAQCEAFGLDNIRWASSDVDNYETKKNIVGYINGMLSEQYLTIIHPENGEPCSLYAVASRDGGGRYIFENKLTKKRSNSSKTLDELKPFRLALSEPRREGLREASKKRRKKQSGE